MADIFSIDVDNFLELGRLVKGSKDGIESRKPRMEL